MLGIGCNDTDYVLQGQYFIFLFSAYLLLLLEQTKIFISLPDRLSNLQKLHLMNYVSQNREKSRFQIQASVQ